MDRSSGKGKPQELDLEHELPAAEAGEGETAAPLKDAGPPLSELEQVKGERDALLDRLARLQAEFENARRRAQREQQEYRHFALMEAIKSLLPILDSLDRALKTADTEAESFRSGIELIDRQFHDALAKLGVEPIEAQGQLFDPNLHQAVQMVDTEAADDQHVIDELQRGYRMKDRLLRPAMVRVARNPNK